MGWVAWCPTHSLSPALCSLSPWSQRRRTLGRLFFSGAVQRLAFFLLSRVGAWELLRHGSLASSFFAYSVLNILVIALSVCSPSAPCTSNPCQGPCAGTVSLPDPCALPNLPQQASATALRKLTSHLPGTGDLLEHPNAGVSKAIRRWVLPLSKSRAFSHDLKLLQLRV